MNEKEKIMQMVSKITGTEFKNEKAAFDETKDVMCERLFDEETTLEDLTTDASGNSEFLKEVGDILSSLTLLAGTIKAYLEIIKLVKKNKETSTAVFENKWKAALIKNGMPSETAERLSKKYHKDLEQIVNPA